jgi:hypothetical protein
MAPENSAMLQFCSVCKSTFEMEVVRESAEDGVIWLRCPNCQGILPHMPQISEPEVRKSPAPEPTESAPRPTADEIEAEAISAAAELLDEIDPEKARPYSAEDTYEVGDVVHHRAWNDYGIVQATETLPGNRHIIRVRFVNAGEVQLLEGQDL